jgi:acyl carrier protein
VSTTATLTELTELIVGSYRDALQDADLDEGSDFFEAGGDSLIAFQITAKLRDELDVAVPVALVFAYPSPAELAAVIAPDLQLADR